MTMKTCEQTSAVLTALRAGRLSADTALTNHVAGCIVCGPVVGEHLFGDVVRAAVLEVPGNGSPATAENASNIIAFPGLAGRPVAGDRVPPDRPAGRERGGGLSEDEAALLVSGFGDPVLDVAELSPDDRGRVFRTARALDRAFPEMPSRVEALGLQAPRLVPDVPVRTAEVAPAPLRLVGGHASGREDQARAVPVDRTGSGRPWLFGVAALAAVAVLAVLVSGPGSGDRLGALLPPDTLTARGSQVGMELGVGGRRCSGVRDPAGWAFRLGKAEPCTWRASSEVFTMNVRVEPGASARYVAVIARDEAGEVSLLYPDSKAADTRLETTRGRRDEGCNEDLCWLEGGRYDVPAGRLSVVAVFSSAPLPVSEMTGEWAPWQWAGAERLVERFELEVVP